MEFEDFEDIESRYGSSDAPYASSSSRSRGGDAPANPALSAAAAAAAAIAARINQSRPSSSAATTSSSSSSSSSAPSSASTSSASTPGFVHPERARQVRTTDSTAHHEPDFQRGQQQYHQRREHCQGGHQQQQQQQPLPELYSVHPGTVAKIESFGAFVEIAGFRKNGLVHISQISSSRVERVDEILAVGEAVFVKVISLDDGKVALAMKYVSQGDGRDLDKNQVQLEMDRQRHAKRGPGEARPIHVENMESILCRRCGGRGHLASNCFHQAGSSAAPYDPEDDDRALRAAEAAADAARASINAAADQKSAAKAARAAEKEEAKRLKKRWRLEADVKSLSTSHVTSVEDARRLLEEESERKRAKKEKKRAKKEQRKQEKKEKKERRKAAKKAAKSSRRSDDDSSSSSSSSDSDESDS